MSHLEQNTNSVGVTHRINALMKRLEERSGKPLEQFQPTTRLVYLLLDCSGSMADEKLSQGKAGALSFAKDAFQKSYGVGFITFNDSALLRLEARPGSSLLPSHVQSLEAEGGTDIACAIDVACAKLRGLPGTKVICIVSDGAANRESTFLARDKARNMGIEIMTLGVDGADMVFLNALATRKDLCVHVPTSGLRIAMKSMAKLLP
jgi:Mg-chelatase subunit ChlD